MKEAAGEGMWMPSEEGEGAATKEPGDGTWSCWALPGEPPASRPPGDGVPISGPGDGMTVDCRDGGEPRGNAAAGEEV